jgi:hypothetical protein
VGLCASTASWLFGAGSERVAMDYSITMIHNPFNPENPDQKVLQVFTDSIVKMLANRSGRNEEEMANLMAVETWMDSSQCKEMGLCDSIRTSKNDKPVLSKTKNAFKEAFNFVNSITNPIIKMNYSKICNKLGIVEASNEDTVLNTIDAIMNKSAADLASAQNLVSEKETELVEIKKKLADLEASSKEELAVKNALVAKAMVKNYHNRISAESIESWEKKAESDLEGTEELLKSIPINKVGANLSDKKENSKTVEAPTNAASLMAEIRVQNLKK